MDTIKISLQEVNDSAQQIRQCSEQLAGLLQEARNEMNALGMDWQSDGSEEIRQRFAQFANRFEHQKEVIDSYWHFLETTVSTYDSMEATIQGNASAFEA